MHSGDLSRVVYRDHITLKHSPRKRLQEELHVKTNRLDQHVPSNGNLCILGPGAEKNDPLSKMLIQYLLEAIKTGRKKLSRMIRGHDKPAKV